MGNQLIFISKYFITIISLITLFSCKNNSKEEIKETNSVNLEPIQKSDTTFTTKDSVLVKPSKTNFENEWPD